MFEAYKIAVSVTLLNHASHGLSLLAKDFAKTSEKVKLLKAQIRSLEVSVLKGGIALGAGIGMMKMFQGPLDEVKKYQVEVTKLSTLGFGDAVNTQAEKFANGMRIMGSSARENLTIMTDAMAVTKDLDKSKIIAPLLAQMAASSKALYGDEEGGNRAKKGLDAVKLLENRNGFSSKEEATSQMDLIQRAINGSRNRVDPSQILTAIRRGGLALSGRSNEQLYLGSEGLIQDLGASGYGTAAMSVYRNQVQGKTTRSVALEAARIGLIKDSDVGKSGFRAGSMVGTDILTKQGELRFMMDVLIPLFKKHGIIKEGATAETNDAAVYSEIGKLYSDRTAAKLMSTVYKNRDLLQEQYHANLNADGLTTTNKKAAKTLAGQEAALQANLFTLKLRLGQVVLPMAIKALTKLNPLLERFSGWIQRHHGLMKLLIGAFTSLAAALTFGGSLYLIVGGFKAIKLAFSLLGLAITANPIGLAFRAIALGVWLLWDNWSTIGPKLKMVWDGIGSGLSAFFNWISSLWTRFKNNMPSWLGGGSSVVEVPNAVRSSGTGSINIGLNLDGKTVAKIVTDHQGRELSRPAGGTSRPDYSHTAPLPAGGTTR